ncbi:MAG: hypothetical protein PHT94_01405 [Candidatus Nanoarchaeia archaeon]|nr:hypothetical protein [Candidatus Nanoarchaeia archaeon]
MDYNSTLKAYDIRGTIDIINEEYTINLALNILEKIDFNSVTISYDTREKSKTMAEVLMNVFLQKEKKVYDLEICSTPISYFLTKRLGTDIGIIVTASHNPLNYLGFKIYKKNLIPFSPIELFQNLKKLETNSNQIVRELFFSKNYEKIDFRSFVNNYFIHNFSYKNLKNLPFIIDFSNGSAITYEHDFLINNFQKCFLINTNLGTFKHSLNPLDEDALIDAKKYIKDYNLNFGIVYDTDADRTVLLDENSNPVSGDDLLLFLIYIKKEILDEKFKVLYDIRSTREIKQYCKKNKIESFESVVGHYFIKKLMKENDIDIGGEKSSHIYFKESNYTENSLILFYYLDAFFSNKNKKTKSISQTIEELHKSISSKELNYEFNIEKDKIIKDLEELFSNYNKEKKDGISVWSDFFWFNIRFSNTENLMRLNLETKNQQIYDKIKNLIEKYLKKVNI